MFNCIFPLYIKHSKFKAKYLTADICKLLLNLVVEVKNFWNFKLTKRDNSNNV